MFSVSLKMIKIDRNMSESWQIVCKIYNINICAFVGFIVWIVFRCTTDMRNINVVEALSSIKPRNRSTSFLTTAHYKVNYLFISPVSSLPVAFCAEPGN